MQARTRAHARDLGAAGRSLLPLLVLSLLASIVGCQSEEERRASLTREISVLEERVEKALVGRELLDRIEVVEATFHPGGDHDPSVRFDIAVVNHTDHRINRIQFRATLVDPAGETLHEGKLDSGLPGSIEPGDTLSFRMAPISSSAWEQIDPPEGSVLRLTPIGLSAIGRRELARERSAEGIARDQAQLASLQSELSGLGR